ncbi:MAG: hypothetical protein KF900_03970 [Bacteroidetes bacterium]|nr:hypothetical protein [Bacteroidota bacterium]
MCKIKHIESKIKKLSVFFFILFLCISSYAQDYVKEKKNDIFFNGFYASLNRTTYFDTNTKNRFGFNIAVTRVGRWKEDMSGVLSLEYSMLRFFEKSVYIYDKFGSTFTNVEYNMQSMTIPLGIRFSIDKKNSFFIEGGTIIGVIVNGRARGTFRGGYPPNMIKETDITQKFSGGFVGLYSAVGTNIPVKKNNLFIKAECRASLNRYQRRLNKYATIVVGLKV